MYKLSVEIFNKKLYYVILILYKQEKILKKENENERVETEKRI